MLGLSHWQLLRNEHLVVEVEVHCPLVCVLRVADRFLDGRLLGGRLLADRLLANRLLADRLLDGRLLDVRLLDGRLLADRLLANRLLGDRLRAERGASRALCFILCVYVFSGLWCLPFFYFFYCF